MGAPSDGLLVRTATKKEYGPHIFARVNFADHVFWRGYGPVFFFGFGAIDGYGPQKSTGSYHFLDSYVNLRNNFADGMRSTVVSH